MAAIGGADTDRVWLVRPDGSDRHQLQTGLDGQQEHPDWSPEAVWDGHEPCGTKGQFTNSIKFILTPNIVDGGSFHPNRSGQKALAALVACYVNANPSAPNPYVGGVEHPIDVVGLPLPADVGLVDPPGSFEAPVPC